MEQSTIYKKRGPKPFLEDRTAINLAIDGKLADDIDVRRGKYTRSEYIRIILDKYMRGEREDLVKEILLLRDENKNQTTEIQKLQDKIDYQTGIIERLQGMFEQKTEVSTTLSTEIINKHVSRAIANIKSERHLDFEKWFGMFGGERLDTLNSELRDNRLIQLLTIQEFYERVKNEKTEL